MSSIAAVEETRSVEVFSLDVVHGRPNIEVVIERDNGEQSAWADYGTQVASPLFV